MPGRHRKPKHTLTVRRGIHDAGLQTGLEGYEVCLCPYQGDAEKRFWLSGWVEGRLQGDFSVPRAVRPLLRRLGVRIRDGSLEKHMQTAEKAKNPGNIGDFGENLGKAARIQEIHENQPRSSKKAKNPKNTGFME